MARLLVAALLGAAVGVLPGSELRAQSESPDEALATDPTNPALDAPGRLQVVGPADVTPADGEISPLAVSDFARVRLTYYLEYGVTFGGGYPYPGSTACSWNWPLGARFSFADGETVTCNDRGLLGSSGWLDVWRNRALASKYGPYTTVRVELP